MRDIVPVMGPPSRARRARGARHRGAGGLRLAGGSSYSPHQHAPTRAGWSRPSRPRGRALQSVVLDGAARAACKLAHLARVAGARAGRPRDPRGARPGRAGRARRGAARRARRRRARARPERPGGRAARRRVGARDRRRGAGHEAALQHPRVPEDGRHTRPWWRACWSTPRGAPPAPGSEPLASYLAALEPGATPDPAVAARLRDGLRRASPPPRATSCSIPRSASCWTRAPARSIPCGWSRCCATAPTRAGR